MNGGVNAALHGGAFFNESSCRCNSTLHITMTSHLCTPVVVGTRRVKENCPDIITIKNGVTYLSEDLEEISGAMRRSQFVFC